MHANKAILKIAAPLLAAAFLAYAGTTIAAPGAASATQQSDEKPDCKKTPDDPRCKKY